MPCTDGLTDAETNHHSLKNCRRKLTITLHIENAGQLKVSMIVSLHVNLILCQLLKFIHIYVCKISDKLLQKPWGPIVTYKNNVKRVKHI